MPLDAVRPLLQSSSRLDELFEAPEIHVSDSHDAPREAALKACLRGELPPPRLPVLARTCARAGDERRALIADLDEITSHFVNGRQHIAGLGALACLRAGELRDGIARGMPVNVETARTLMPTASMLSRCLDALELWPILRGRLQESVDDLGDPLIVPRWYRLLDLSKEVAREADYPGQVPVGSSVPSLKDLNDLTSRIESLAKKMAKMLPVASTLFMLADAQTLSNDKLRELLADYEDAVAECLRRTSTRDGGADPAALDRIANYDSARLEVLFLEGQMSNMRDDLLGARTGRGAPDRRVPVRGFTELFERC